MRTEPDVRPEDHDRALEVVVQWGDSVLYAEHVRAPDALELGEQLGFERLVLARQDVGGARLFLPTALGAGATIDGVPVDDAQLGADAGVELPEGAAARVELRGLSVFVRSTQVPRAQALRALQPARLAQPWTMASLGAHLLVLALFYVLPPHSHALNVDDVDLRSRLVRFALDARAREPEPPEWTEPGKEPGAGTPGRAAADDPGKIGDPKAPKAPKRAASRGPSPTPSLASGEVDPQDAGILGMLRAAAPSASSRFDAAHAIGSDAENAIGALLGDQIGPSFGHGGLGMIGTGRGAGGDGLGTLGVGPLGTFGMGIGKQGRGYGANGGGLGPRAPRVPPRLVAYPPEVRGGLSKEVIRRVVHRHLAEVRHCYEQRLIARPDLQGRVAVRFIIGATGAVAAAVVTSSTIEDAAVAPCIANAVKRWSFPTPEGSGIVSVTYPFVLQQSGR
jgi:hypothetical protein